MNNLDPLLQRNKQVAAQQSAEGTLMPSLPRVIPNVKAIIIACADMRVDPAHVLGIKPGEVDRRWRDSGVDADFREWTRTQHGARQHIRRPAYLVQLCIKYLHRYKI